MLDLNPKPYESLGMFRGRLLSMRPTAEPLDKERIDLRLRMIDRDLEEVHRANVERR